MGQHALWTCIYRRAGGVCVQAASAGASRLHEPSQSWIPADGRLAKYIKWNMSNYCTLIRWPCDYGNSNSRECKQGSLRRLREFFRWPSAHVHTASKFYENTQASSYIENRCRCSTVAAYMQVTIVPSRACKCAIWPEFTIIYTRVRLVNNG